MSKVTGNTASAVVRGVPAKLGANGIGQIIEIKLISEEQPALERSGAVKQLVGVSECEDPRVLRSLTGNSV